MDDDDDSDMDGDGMTGLDWGDDEEGGGGTVTRMYYGSGYRSITNP